MQTTTVKSQERTDDRIRRRAAWESFSFEVPAPRHVTVTNHSYGDEADQHRYTVMVEDGEAVACSCPFFEHHEQTCKHMIAVQAEAAVIAAASMALDQDGDEDKKEPSPSSNETEKCEHGQPNCPGPGGVKLPCFDCFSVQEVR